MKFEISLKTKCIPSDYRFMIVSLIKNLLENADKEYYEKLYLYKGKANKKSKPFVFNLRYTKYTYKENEIHIDGKCILEISCPSTEFMIYLQNGLVGMKEPFVYKGKYIIEVIDVKPIMDTGVTDSKVFLNAKNPIVISNKEGRYLQLDKENEEFQKELNYITDLNLRNYRGKGLSSPIELFPINMKKSVVKMDLEHRADTFRVLHVNGYKGTCLLTGDIQDLNDIVSMGIGFMRSMGFGYVEQV